MIIVEHECQKINEEIIKMSDHTTSTIHMEYIMPWKGLSVNQKRLDVNIFITISGLYKLRTVFGRFQFINTEDKVCKGLEQGVDKGSVTDSHDIKLVLKIKLV